MSDGLIRNEELPEPTISPEVEEPNDIDEAYPSPTGKQYV